MNIIEVVIYSVEDAEVNVRSNYPVRCTFGPTIPSTCGTVMYIYEGFEDNIDQIPLFSVTLGPQSPDDHDDETVLRFEDGKLIS